MTTEQVKEAMRAESPVSCCGIEYARVSAIIFRKSQSGIIIQVELLDKNNNSITIARPDRVELKGKKEG